MLPPRAEFDVLSAGSTIYETQTDSNGNRLENVEALIKQYRRQIRAIPGLNGGSGKPWVVVDIPKDEFRFAFKTTQSVPANQEFINQLDKFIPTQIPTNIPFVLENIGVVQPQTLRVREVMPTPQTPVQEAGQREQRRYFVIR